MSQPKSLDLAWKNKIDGSSLLLDMTAVEAWLRANAGPSYLGNSSDQDLTLWFSDEPSVELKDLIETYWAHLDENSAEAKSYADNTTREAQVAQKAESGKAKLLALGLTAAEISAMLGN